MADHTRAIIDTESEGQPTGEVYVQDVVLPKPLYDELRRMADMGGWTLTQLIGVGISELVKDFNALAGAIERGEVNPDPQMHPRGKLILDIRQQRRVKRISMGH